MKNRLLVWNGEEPVWTKWLGCNHQLDPESCVVRNQSVIKMPCGNPRTYVPRIIRPIRACRFTHRFPSGVDIEHKKLLNCCGKWKAKTGMFTYVHRIVDIGKELPPQ